MRNRQYGQCLEEHPHGQHLFYPGFFTRKVICKGVEPEPKPHKHFYKLVTFFVSEFFARQIVEIPKGRIGWQCLCGATLSRDRYALLEEMRPDWKNVDQTWPS